MFRTGVVGVGHWGRKVAREYITLVKDGMLESMVLCDLDDSRLREFNGECKTVNDLN